MTANPTTDGQRYVSRLVAIVLMLLGLAFGLWATWQAMPGDPLETEAWVYPLEVALCGALGLWAALTLVYEGPRRLWWRLGWLPLICFAAGAVPVLLSGPLMRQLILPETGGVLWDGHLYHSPIGFNVVVAIALTAAAAFGLLPLPFRVTRAGLRLILQPESGN